MGQFSGVDEVTEVTPFGFGSESAVELCRDNDAEFAGLFDMLGAKVKEQIKDGQTPGTAPWDVGRTKAQNQRLAEVFIRFNRGEQPSERGGKRVHNGGFALREVDAAVAREKLYRASLSPQDLAARDARFKNEQAAAHAKRRSNKGIGHFISNTVKLAGRELGKVANTVQDLEGKVTGIVAKIPIVGAPLKSVYDMQYHLTVGPLIAAGQIAGGRPINRAVIGHFKDLAKDVHNVAPLAQSVISFVPGIGQGVSAALGAGLALAEGQPLDKVAEAAIVGAIPGGPAVAAVYHVASNGVKAAVSGKKFDFVDAAKEGLGAGLGALGLPPAATQALTAGVTAAGKIAHGEPLDKALTTSAVDALPVPSNAKAALHEATDLSIALAHGQPVDKALLARVDSATSQLPIPAEVKTQIRTAVKTGKSLVEGQPIGKSLGVALHSAVADTLIDHGSKTLSPDAKKALSAGLVVGTAISHQAHKGVELRKVTGKLTQNGVQLFKAVPAIAEARKLAGAGTKGFDHAMGLVSHGLKPFDILHARDLHKGADRLGFDMALSVKNGLVAAPIPQNLSPAAAAGHAMAFGTSGMPIDNQATIAKVVAAHPSADVGAKVASKSIQHQQKNIIARVFYAIGFR
jgi:hypothetical protein